ncbi:MAG TPA: NAD(P)/FAD-dependent oxidoreductase [Methanocorpusculum sp.]|nr:NAD(P)/FAD-dependent oxidoreductase [Methanocorpusculum sp.]
MEIGILGAGLTGLTAAYALSDTATCTIFEKNSEIGGCLASADYGKYHLETLYHHCFSGDNELFRLLDTFGLRNDLLWLKGSTGYVANGRLEPVTTPMEIMKWSALSLGQKIRLGLFVLRSRGFDAEKLDTIQAETYLREKLGDGIYNAFFMPLLRSKFGERAGSVSAAWLMSRIAIRSDRGAEGERLGYLRGGWGRFIDAFSAALEKKNCRILKNTPAESIEYINNKWRINGQDFDVLISTIPPQTLKKLMKDPSVVTTIDVPYQGSACMTLGLKRDPCNGIYWTNMGDKAPYGAVVVHTNFAPYEWYGEHVVYLASYFSGTPSPTLEKDMLDDFCKRFKIEFSEINHANLYLEPLAGPVFETGYRKRIPPVKIGPSCYSAGMFSAENYPERSMEGSIKAGRNIADLVMNQ